MTSSLDRYRFGAQLGRGGMGVVFWAMDEELGRPVAIKRVLAPDEEVARKRFLREARTAARFNHPRICQVYEVGEQAGELYLVMELLEGKALSERLAAGPLELNEAFSISLEILEGLAAMHAQGFVHRDLKPSNVFLTPHGVKLLDFGLALPLHAEAGVTDERLTSTGVLIGTPGFMAPEQWTGEEVGPPCDLFALGALLFEMVSGRPAFGGSNPLEVYHAVVYEQPPALAGGESVMALDRVIQRALSKRPIDRYPSARTMAESLREVSENLAGMQITGVRALTRLLVLPFRLYQDDPELAFLGEGLAEALNTALSGLENLVVRSTSVARRFASEEPDLEAIATDAEVDAVVFGSVGRHKNKIRAAAELVEVPSGTKIWSGRIDEESNDLFRVEEAFVQRIVEGLALPLSARDLQQLERKKPIDAEAYELYLRANQLSYHSGMLSQAGDLYRACLKEAPDYAPAWARLGRVYRILSKYGRGDVRENRQLAKDAFERALALDPDLATAHNLYAYFEIEELGQPKNAMVRLLNQARRHPADPELYAGLVVACRFCGLTDAAIAAHLRARRLDPGLRTSAAYTYFMAGDYERALLHDDEDMRYVRHPSLPLLGRTEECIASCRELEGRGLEGLERHFIVAIRAALEGDGPTAVASVRAVVDSEFPDAEGLFFLARCAIHAGDLELGTDMLETILDRGFCCAKPLREDPWLEPVRQSGRDSALLARADSILFDAIEAYVSADGTALLGVTVPTLPPE